MDAVAADIWEITEELAESRRSHLLSDKTPMELLEIVEAEARKKVMNGAICVNWKEAKNAPGHFRIESTIPLEKETYDLLFNGRLGYRAQYYLSTDHGRKFNRLLVNRLKSVIRGCSTCSVDFEKVKQSLDGEHSKIWVTDDWAAFCREPEVLIPARWKAYWSKSPNEPFGLKAPMPDDARLDLKGTFICQPYNLYVKIQDSTSHTLPVKKAYRIILYLGWVPST